MATDMVRLIGRLLRYHAHCETAHKCIPLTLWNMQGGGSTTMQSHTADATDTDHNGAGLVQRLQEENQKLREALKAALSLTVKQQLGGSMGGSGSSPAAPHEQPAGGGVEGASEGSAIRASASPLVSKGARAQANGVPRKIRPTDVWKRFQSRGPCCLGPCCLC